MVFDGDRQGGAEQRAGWDHGQLMFEQNLYRRCGLLAGASAPADGFPESVGHLDRHQIRNEDLEFRAHPLVEQFFSLRRKRFCVQWWQPFRYGAGVDDYRFWRRTHRSRSSRIISSAVGNLPWTTGTEARSCMSLRTTSRRRRSSFSVGILASRRAITSAARERRFSLARLRRAS